MLNDESQTAYALKKVKEKKKSRKDFVSVAQKRNLAFSDQSRCYHEIFLYHLPDKA